MNFKRETFPEVVRRLQEGPTSVVAWEDGETDDFTTLLALRSLFRNAKHGNFLVMDPAHGGKDREGGAPNDVYRKKVEMLNHIAKGSVMNAIIEGPGDATKALESANFGNSEYLLFVISAPLFTLGGELVAALRAKFPTQKVYAIMYRGNYNGGPETSDESMEALNLFFEESCDYMYEVSRFTAAGPDKVGGVPNVLYESILWMGPGGLEHAFGKAPTAVKLMKEFNMFFYDKKTSPIDVLRKGAEYGTPEMLEQFNKEAGPLYGDGKQCAYYEKVLEIFEKTIKWHRRGPMLAMYNMLKHGHNSSLTCDQWIAYFILLGSLGYDDSIVETCGAFYTKGGPRRFKAGAGPSCELTLKPECLAEDLATTISLWKGLVTMMAKVAESFE